MRNAEPHERRSTPRIVLQVGLHPSLHSQVPEFVVGLGITDRSLFPGRPLQPMRNGPPLVYPEGLAPDGLLGALEAFLPANLLGYSDPPNPEEDRFRDVAMVLAKRRTITLGWPYTTLLFPCYGRHHTRQLHLLSVPVWLSAV